MGKLSFDPGVEVLMELLSDDSGLLECVTEKVAPDVIDDLLDGAVELLLLDAWLSTDVATTPEEVADELRMLLPLDEAARLVGCLDEDGWVEEGGPHGCAA